MFLMKYVIFTNYIKNKNVIKNNYLILIIVILFSSCVSQKDLLYLQGNPNTKAVVSPINTPYRVQVNDVLQINVKALDQNLVRMFTSPSGENGVTKKSQEGLYFDGYSIDPEGNIRIPVLGKLFVLGKTTDEIQQIIEKKLLSDYFKKDTYVFVSAKLSGFKVTVQGEVGSPGTVILYQNSVNIMEVIANAGDINFVGDRKNVMIIRKTPNGQEIHKIDLTSIAALDSPYYYLQPNDYIYVKPLKQKSWGTGTTGTQTMTTVISVLSLVTTVIILTR